LTFTHPKNKSPHASRSGAGRHFAQVKTHINCDFDMSKSKFIQNRCVCIAIFGKENTHQLLIGWHVVIYFWGVLYGRAVLQI